MYINNISLKKIIEDHYGDIIGDKNKQINGINDVYHTKANQITFADNKKYFDKALESLAAAVIISKELYSTHYNTIINKPQKSFIVVDHPILLFNELLNQYSNRISFKSLCESELNELTEQGLDIGNNVKIGINGYIGEDVKIGNDISIWPMVFIGDNVTIGDNVEIFPNVSIIANTIIGNNVIINSGAVIGSRGFCYGKVGETYVAQAMRGKIVIEDDVEIGANVTIDMSSTDETRIAAQTKIDNLVHIAHDVTIGNNTLILGMVGIAGQSTIGNNVILRGQSGIVAPATIHDNIEVAPKAGVHEDIIDQGRYINFPIEKEFYFKKYESNKKRLASLFATVSLIKKVVLESNNGDFSIAKKLKSIISDQLEIEYKKVDFRKELVDDLGADSLDMVELIMAVEEEFDIQIPDEDAKKIITGGDLLRFVTSSFK